MKRIIFITSLSLLVSLSSIAIAQSGALDNSFGIDGKVITSLGSFGDKGNAMAIQSDGKILLGGLSQNSFTSSDFAIIRCNNDGTLDNAFGIGGIVKTFIENRSEGDAIALQSDGKILLGGFSQWFVNIARYNNDGTLDTAFGIGGTNITDVIGYYSEKCKSIAVQSDGKIIVGAYGMHNSNDNPYFVLLRYNDNGMLDSTFGDNGQVIGPTGICNSMAIQNDGKILLAGSTSFNYAMLRYKRDGTLDSSFGINGEVITPVGLSGEANTLLIQNDEKILLAGYSFNSSGNSDFTMLRYNSDGTLDNSFGVGSKVITPVGTSNANAISLGIQSDGKILLAGIATDMSMLSEFAIARYDSNGTLDNSFGTGGKVISSLGSSYSIATSLCIQSDDKIILGGYSHNGTNTDMAMIRYDNDESNSIEEMNEDQLACNIYPNPFRIATKLFFNTRPKNATIIVYNVFGEAVLELKNISEQEIEISSNQLSSGFYMLRIMEDNKLICAKKLSVE